MLPMDRYWQNKEKLDAAIEVYLYRLQELEWDDESQKTPSGLTLDLPLALAEVYRRQGIYR